MKLIIVRPPSSVKSEISIINMNIVNNFLCNSMGQKRLNSLMICSIRSDTNDELNINELILSFLKQIEWRERYFMVGTIR